MLGTPPTGDKTRVVDQREVKTFQSQKYENLSPRKSIIENSYVLRSEQAVILLQKGKMGIKI